jgi:hypothetical protein
MVEFGLNERLKYGDISGHFVIPAEIGGQFVTSIGANAFAYGLISIEIPHGVTSIGVCAFFGCSGLTSIEIPNCVISVGSRAFYGCIRLTSLEIPNSVITIALGAFAGCRGLNTLKFSLPMRKLFPYKWVNALNLSSTFVYVFEFLSWQDLARMTMVSKYFYSNVMVRCRKDFMYKRIGESNVVIESDRPAELCITGSAQCVPLDRRDELALYSSDCSGVRSVCVPPSFQEAAPAVVEVEERKK